MKREREEAIEIIAKAIWQGEAHAIGRTRAEPWEYDVSDARKQRYGLIASTAIDALIAAGWRDGSTIQHLERQRLIEAALEKAEDREDRYLDAFMRLREIPGAPIVSWNDEEVCIEPSDISKRLSAAEEQNRRMREVLAPALAVLPDGVWETWTSCSYRRIIRVGGGDVLHAYNQRSDRHPDLSWTEEQCEAICTVVNTLRAAFAPEEADARAALASTPESESEAIERMARAIWDSTATMVTWDNQLIAIANGDGDEFAGVMKAEMDLARNAARAALSALREGGE